ncbi:hypothetical protein AMECASPLE_003158 [Ameca splendens]|uniref:Uncharacterized protein n=1 Tax=Ameca splendens TaxID=208324 RepID=A0ABV0ZJJ7_9TELE
MRHSGSCSALPTIAHFSGSTDWLPVATPAHLSRWMDGFDWFPAARQAPQRAPPPHPAHLASTLGSASPASTSGT